MSDYLILDLLFGVIVVLFAAIGMWRGVVKEIPVTAAIFLGAALASSWAVPWGNDLAREADLRTDVSRMIVTASALLGATLILGYGGGALIASHELGWGSRLIGGILAAINGGLILHFVLHGVESFFTGEATRDALRQSEVARILLREFGWILVAVASLLALCIVIAAIWGRNHLESDYGSAPTFDAEADPDYSVGSRGRSARLPTPADSGKYEPVRSGFDSQTGRYAADAPSIRQTVALPPVDANRIAFEGGRAAPADSSQARRDQTGQSPKDTYAGEEWIRRAPYTQIPDQPYSRRGPVPDSESHGGARSADDQRRATDTRHDQSDNGQHGNNGAASFAWIGYPPASGFEPPRAKSGEEIQPRRCTRCAGELGENDDFCPHCGNHVASK